MVVADYYSDLDKLVLSFKQVDEFDQLIAILKKSRFTFKKKLSKWVGEVRHIFEIEDELNFWDELSYGDNSREDLWNYAYPDFNPKRSRLRYDTNTLKFNPLVKEQHEAINHVLRLDNSILRADTGTGKSFMSTGAIVTRFKNKQITKTIFLTVPSVMYSMQSEFYKFTDYFKEGEVQVVLSKNKECFDPSAKVLIMSHDTFRLISIYWHKKVTKKTPKKPTKSYLPIQEWAENGGVYLVVDECHKIKNRSSLRFIYLNSAKDLFKYKIMMSGTLLPNGFKDSWTYAKFLEHDAYYNLPFAEWADDVYEKDTTYSEYGLGDLKKDRRDFYLSRLQKIIYSINKEVLKLPGCTEKDVIVPMGRKLTKIYQMITQHKFSKIIETEDGLTTQNVHQKLPYAVACTNDVSLLNKNALQEAKFDTATQITINTWNFAKDNPKLKYADMIISEELEEDKLTKFIIWAESPTVIDLLGEYYQKYKPIVIHGQNTPRGKEKFSWRNEQVNLFKSDKKVQMLIANPATLGVGLNITCARVAINWARPFDLEKVEQALGRVYRPGMVTIAHIYNLIFGESYDVAVTDCLKEKLTLEKLISNMNPSKHIKASTMKYLLTGRK